MEQTDDWVSKKKAARLLDVSISWIEQKARDGRLTPHRLPGGMVRFRRSQVLALPAPCGEVLISEIEQALGRELSAKAKRALRFLEPESKEAFLAHTDIDRAMQLKAVGRGTIAELYQARHALGRAAS